MTQLDDEPDDRTADVPSTPPGEHGSELPDEDDQPTAASAAQEENAETSLDQPSQ